MTEAKERKKKTSSGDQAQRVPPASVGEILRRARLEKGLGLEQVSSAINIRVAQLRALEEGNIDALPGMTYALGFVRSYANYLRLNSGEIVHKFKAEHGGAQSAKPELHFPEPVGESRLPDPQMLAIAGAFVVLLLVIWAVFSDGDSEEADIATQIPPPPVVQPLSDMAAAPLFSTTDASSLTETGAPAEAVAVSAEAAAVAQPLQAQAQEQEQQQTLLSALSASAPKLEEKPAATEPPEAVLESEPISVVPVPEKKKSPPEVQAQAKEQPEGVINISRGKSRIVLQATQSSWIQVSNAKQDILIKKVLKPGEKYFVPDEAGVTLVTSNAGGLEVYVDGAVVQSLGKPGGIVRGIALDPQELKKKKIKVRD